MSKHRYKEFINSTSKDVPLFHEDGWLDAVCDDNHWDVCMAENIKNGLTLYLPFYQETILGQTVIKMPPVTPYLGPILESKNKYVIQSDFQNSSIFYQLLNDAISQFPNSLYFTQCMAPKFINHLPFRWNGYKSETFYSYILPITDIDNVKTRLKSKLRNTIKRAGNQLSIEGTLSPEELYLLIHNTFKRQNLKLRYSLNILNNIYTYLSETDRHKIFVAKDHSNNIHGALYMVWDGSTAYNLISANTYKAPGLSTTQLLIYNAILYAHYLGLSYFDFEGGMIQNIESVYRLFRGNLTPYHHIYKGGNKFFDVLQVLRK